MNIKNILQDGNSSPRMKRDATTGSYQDSSRRVRDQMNCFFVPHSRRKKESIEIEVSTAPKTFSDANDEVLLSR